MQVQDSLLSLCASILSVHCPLRLHIEPLKLLNFDFSDPDPAFRSNADSDPYPSSKNNADPDTASKNKADPDPEPC
jgi:hypothetical protein